MNGLAKDISQALIMGILVPYVVLSAGLRLWERERGPTPVFETAAQQEGEHPTLSINLRMQDGASRKMDLETYLTGVVLAEMPTSFGPEALKAQAVAARTFAVKSIATGGKHGDGSLCTNSGCCQAYVTAGEYLLRGGTDSGLQKVRDAVAETSGQVLTYGDALIEATYYACSGGRSEDAVSVWGTDYPYLISVDSPGEEDAAHYRDRETFSPEEFQKLLGRKLPGTPSNWFGPVTYTAGGGVETIQIGAVTYTGTELRSLLGLRSSAFAVGTSEGEIVFETSGNGHRVGMSQYGANAMAASGSTCAEILAHYYPGTTLKQMEEGAQETVAKSTEE